MNQQLQLLQNETSPLPPSPARQTGAQGGNNSAPKKKQQTWEQQYAGIFYYKFQEETGEKCKLGFGALINMLQNYSEKNWLNKITGEIELPSVEAWTEEINEFFKDDFAGTQRGFHFSYLLKQFGSFKKIAPKKRTAETDFELIHKCTKCFRIARQKKSVWLRYRNQQLQCKECHTPYNVNDVLNQFQTLNEYLPKQ